MADHPQIGGRHHPRRTSPRRNSVNTLALAALPTPARIEERMRELHITQSALARYLSVTQPTINRLLSGRWLYSTALGFDRWPETLMNALNDIALARTIMQRHAQAAVKEITAQKLLVPEELTFCLPGATPIDKVRKHLPTRRTYTHRNTHAKSTAPTPAAPTETEQERVA